MSLGSTLRKLRNSVPFHKETHCLPFFLTHSPNSPVFTPSSQLILPHVAFTPHIQNAKGENILMKVRLVFD